MIGATNDLAIRALRAGEDRTTFGALARLLADAYPVMRITTNEALAARADDIARSIDQELTTWVIAERGGVLAGAMRLYDYQMNVRGRDAFTGGVGSVAVAPTEKRRGVARALIAWYLDDYRLRGAAFAVLHPFRPSFYRALGFGYGTPLHRFRFAAATLRPGPVRGTIRILDPDDAAAVHACYERVRATTNGLIARHRAATERALADAELRIVGVEEAGELRGFMQTSVALGADDLRNRDELVVRDLVYEDDAALAALVGYLRSQSDQFARIAVESQDAALHLISDDPRDGSDEAVAPPATHRIATTGLGVMYRVLDVDAAFTHLGPAAAPFALEVDVRDDFFAATAGRRTVRFGPLGPARPDPAAEPDARLSIGIAELSSLIVGSLRLRDVVRAGLATLEPSGRIAEADAAFAADRPPICTTRF